MLTLHAFNLQTMKRYCILLTILATCLQLAAQRSARKTIAIIPEPAAITQQNGVYKLPASLSITYTAGENMARLAQQLADRLGAMRALPVKTALTRRPASTGIFMGLVKDASIPNEGYRLKVTASGVQLTASSEAGIFYGIQTIYQLLPPAIYGKDAYEGVNWEMPCVTIADQPRFGWRGIMLDVVRHWFTKDQVKQFIDDMVQFKFNLLHLHLSDDQGWRIEIKSLPKLTEIGAWRAPRTGRWGEFTKPTPDEPKTYGGFYTQDDMRELIEYARQRYVNILPEIDIPGHSMAAVASYPELTCTTDSTYQVNAGERFTFWPGDGTFYATIDNTLCPANEKVYVFLIRYLLK